MELAPFCKDASVAAADTQRAFLRMHRIQLTLIIVAALVGASSLVTERPAVDWSGVIAATLFGVSLLLRVLMTQRKDEGAWYAARQAAEVSKSLCYQFAFGGTNFERSSPQREADVRFIDAFSTIGRGVLILRSTVTEGYSEITDDMRATRSLPFPEATARYFETRIRNQERWYSERAAFHLRRSRMWLTVMLVAQVGGLFFGILKAVTLGGPFGGLVGLMSAVAAAAIAWSQLRQHSMLAGTYQNQAAQLRDFGRRLVLVSEDEWPAFVAAVEGSLIAEHTHWQGLQGFGR